MPVVLNARLIIKISFQLRGFVVSPKDDSVSTPLITVF